MKARSDGPLVRLLRWRWVKVGGVKKSPAVSLARHYRTHPGKIDIQGNLSCRHGHLIRCPPLIARRQHYKSQ